MSFKMPSTDQVRELGDSLGMDVTGDCANSFISFVQSFADGKDTYALAGIPLTNWRTMGSNGKR
jgi:hypothetical protein